ncbi:MAG: PAS domain S-box protein [Rhodospirillales bacterium]|nr:PAS domain S-box protein [Rhodospirillales bacterium]
MTGSSKARLPVGGKAGAADRRDRQPMPEETLGQLRQILDVPGYAIISVDGEGRITLFNQGAERLFGWSAGEMAGGAVDALFPGGLPGTATPERDGFQNIVGRRKDGTEFAAEAAVSRLKSDGGPALTAVVRETRDEGREIFENAGIGFYRTSLDGRPLRVNQASVAMMGYDDEDALLAAKKDVATEWYVDPGRRAEFRRLVEKNGQVADFESEVYRFQTGEHIWVLETARVVRDGDGRPLYYEGTVIDITERKRTREALRESEEKFRAVVDCAPAIIHLKDAEGRFRVVNKAFEDFYGAPAADALGKTAYDLFPKAQADAYTRLDRSVLESGSILVREVETPVENGEPRTVRSVRFPIPGAGGEPVGIGVVAEDVTERKRVEEALKETTQQLNTAIESFSDGFMLFDRDDRFVLSNSAYRNSHPKISDLQKVGMKFETIVRKLAESGFYGNTPDQVDDVVRARIEKHRSGDPFEFRTKTGRWFRMVQYKTPEGGSALVQIDMTEQRRVEEALRESEEALRQEKSRLSLLLESSPSVIYACKASGDFGATYISDNIRNIMGFEPEQFVNDPGFWKNGIHPEDAPRVFEELQQLFVHGTYSHEYRFRKPDGSFMWVEDNLNLIYDSDGNPQNIIGAWSDITERRRVDEALRESEAHNRAILNSVLDGIVTINEEGTITSFNAAAESIFGFAAKEAVGRNVNMLMPEPERSEHDGYLANYLKTGQAGIIGTGREVIGRRKDGTLFPLVLAVSALTLEDRRMFVGVTRDITERKLAQEALSESEERFRTLVGNMTDNVFVHDTEGRFRMVNTTALENLGYTEAELLDMSVPDIDVDATEAVVQGLWRKLAEGRSLAAEGRHRRKDGSTFPVEVLLNGFQAGDERLIMAVARDITDRKRAEKELRLAMEEAETASRAKSEFLSSMSHELRTPMNAILGFGQLLQIDPKEPLSNNQRDYVDAILKGGEHLLRLIDDVLDLSVIEAGRIELSYESVASSEVVEECVSLSRMVADKRGIMIDDRCDSARPSRVWADRTRLKQVLLNLLSNAVKYNNDGGRVMLDCRPTPDGMVRLSVTDTGKGIRVDLRDELFLPFSRLGAEKSGVDGTGIGLALCKRLVELMGGRIGYESEAGQGSTFWIELPPATGEGDDDRPRPPRPAASGQRCVLYVEDNPSNIHLMEAIVDRLPGIALISAHNAELALHMAEAQAPAAIVMDINLPGMDGFEALKRLRRSAPTRDIPVIALSSAALKADVDRGFKAGFYNYLTKPIRVEVLLAALGQVLDAKGGANDSRPA